MYPAVHRSSAARKAYGTTSLPQTERVADGLFSIPLFPHMTIAQQDRVAEGLLESIGKAGG
jgi:dTDP-4-amino-4,6-dideoxygalactose transaminase